MGYPTTMLQIDTLNPLPRPVPLGALNLVFLFLALSTLFSSNPITGLAAILQLRLLLHFYWRKGLPLFGLLLMLMPWLEISTNILEANFRGISLNEMLHGTGDTAYWMAFAGLCCVHLGFYKEFKKNASQFHPESLRQFALQLSLNRLMLIYAGLFFSTSLVSTIIGGRASVFFQLTTYFNQIASVILVVICLRQAVLKQNPKVYFAFLGAIIILSFYSLFSNWKFVAYAIFIGHGITQVVDRKLFSRIVFLLVIFGGLAILWQSIKQDYRIFLTGSGETGGLVSQSIVRGRQESLAKFFELSTGFLSAESEAQPEVQSDNSALYSNLRRVGYLEFFSMVLNEVPHKIPHENGALIKESLSFALIPRFLNPNKGVKDDAGKVTKYTGFFVISSSSFSLGHYAEHFIDFGFLGLLIVLLIFGKIGGLILILLFKRQHLQKNALFSIATTYVVLMHWGSFQSDFTFIVGTLFFSFICHGFVFAPLYSFIMKWTSNAT